MRLTNIEEKLEAIDQVIHQAQLRSVLMKKKGSVIESINSNDISRRKPKVGYSEVKILLNSTYIPEEPETEDLTPQNLKVLKSRAKVVYEKMIHRLEPIKKDILRSVTPTLSLAKL